MAQCSTLSLSKLRKVIQMKATCAKPYKKEIYFFSLINLARKHSFLTTSKYSKRLEEHNIQIGGRIKLVGYAERCAHIEMLMATFEHGSTLIF